MINGKKTYTTGALLILLGLAIVIDTAFNLSLISYANGEVILLNGLAIIGIRHSIAKLSLKPEDKNIVDVIDEYLASTTIK